MKEKLKTVWFIMVVLSVLAQTALTFVLLYNKTQNKIMNDIIIVLTLSYIFAFLLIVLLSLHAKKISREAMSGYKRSLKVVKRVLTLLMLVMSVMNLINAGTGGADFIFSIILIVFNLVVIYIDLWISRIKDKFARKRKHREREKNEERVRAYRIGTGGLNKSKRRGDSNEE